MTHSADRDWVAALTGSGQVHDDAVRRLHDLLVRGARTEAGRRSGVHGVHGRELDDLADQAAADALVSVLRQVDGFRGDSRFTTWAYKFVVREVASKLSRHAWSRAQPADVDEAWAQLPARLGAGPEAVAESRDLLHAVRRAVAEVLTPRQREVFVAIVVDGQPLDAVVAQSGGSRNTIYKVMFDARRKLHDHLVGCGYLRDEECAS